MSRTPSQHLVIGQRVWSAALSSQKQRESRKFLVNNFKYHSVNFVFIGTLDLPNQMTTYSSSEIPTGMRTPAGKAEKNQLTRYGWYETILR